jgi:hypothetical protein
MVDHMGATPEIQLVYKWVRFCRKHGSDENYKISDEEFVFWEELIDLVKANPSLAWATIVEIANDLKTPGEFAYLAAGPFEDLLVVLADQAVDFCKSETKALHMLLPYVWTGSMHPDTREWVIKSRAFLG